jgi:predicted nucleic-acid-binding protein
VRYLVEDDPARTNRVERFLAASRVAGEPAYVSSIIMCETAWVLRRVFGQPEPETVNHLEQIERWRHPSQSQIWAHAVHPYCL